MTWSWGGGGGLLKQCSTNAGKKQIKEENELKREKWDVLKKSGVLQIEHYSKTSWLREEETPYLQLQIYKLRSFSDKRFSKTWKNLHFEVLTKYSCESLGISNSLLEVIFCPLTELAWCELPGWYRFMIVTVFLVPESWSHWPKFYLKLNVLSCLGWFWWFWRCTVVFRSGQSWVTVTVLRFSSFSRFWACRQHDEDLVHVTGSITLLSLFAIFWSSANCNIHRSIWHVRRANYRAAIWRRIVFSLGALFLAHMAMVGSASLNHPVTHSSDEILWMTRPAAPQASSFVGPDHMRLHIRLLHTAL